MHYNSFTGNHRNAYVNSFLRYLFYCMLCTFISCATPRSAAYQDFYAHLEVSQAFEGSQAPIVPIHDSDYFLEIFVDARHLDYTNNISFLNTIAKHPSDGSKNRDVGHAWIHLHGVVDGQTICVEGGHSGELGIVQPKYFDGIMNYIDYGYTTPPSQPNYIPRYEPNPVKYLWETQRDGFFQKGTGRHTPTYGVRIHLTPSQFLSIYSFINTYPFAEYAITKNQCTSFAARIASLAGIDLECEVTMKIEQSICYRGAEVKFWTDSCYSSLTIASPDVLEKSLMNAVRQGKAERRYP